MALNQSPYISRSLRPNDDQQDTHTVAEVQGGDLGGVHAGELVGALA